MFCVRYYVLIGQPEHQESWRGILRIRNFVFESEDLGDNKTQRLGLTHPWDTFHLLNFPFCYSQVLSTYWQLSFGFD